MKILTLFALLLSIQSQAFVEYETHLVLSPDRSLQREMIQKHSNWYIDHVSASGFEVSIPRSDLAELKHFVEQKGVFAIEQNHEENIAQDYPTPEQVNEQLIRIQKKYPQLVQLLEIGKSTEGRPLLFARITNSANLRRVNKPEFKYIANMHGDEIAGREFMVALIEDLVMNYGKDSRITALLDRTDIYIMPSMNPDGAARRQRVNAQGRDLNRSFPDFSTNDNQNNWSNRPPETAAMMKFQAQHKFKLSANFHGGAEVVNYPWDTIADPHPINAWVLKISNDYAQGVDYMKNSSEFKGGIVNGYAWYEVNGGMQDWSYHWHRDLQVTVELTQQKWPSYSSLPQVYQANRDSLIGYIEKVHQF